MALHAKAAVVSTASLALIAVASGCRDHGQGAAAPATRPPTRAERAVIARAVDETWEYESAPLYAEASRHVRPRRPHLRPRILRIAVARAHPRFASAVVELLDGRGRRNGAPAVVLFERPSDPQVAKEAGAVDIAGPAIVFPRACGASTPSGLRPLVCPNPWAVLRHERPPVRGQTAYAQPIRSPNLHAVDWRKVALPGAVCGSSRPIRARNYGDGPEAFIHADVDLLWWNPVWVYSWGRPRFGDLDGDGRDEAALQVVCANGGGTADGQLAFSDVIFKALGKTLRVVGIVTPRQPPLDLDKTHVPLSLVSAIGRGRVVVSEAWYGRYDGTCCASGRARTIWTYRGGRLRPSRTTILRKPWSSPLQIGDLLARPPLRELNTEKPTKIAASRKLRFVLVVANQGRAAVRHIAVTLTIGQPPSPIARTRIIREIVPGEEATVVVGKLGRLRLRRTTVTINIHDRGTSPMRYPVILTRG